MENGPKNDGISAIFFDLDNTLIPTRKGDTKTCNQIAQILCEKYAVPQEKASTMCSSFLKNFRKHPDNPATTLDSWRITLWSKALGDRYGSLAGEVYNIWLQLRYENLSLTPSVAGLLRDLRRTYLLALITNGPTNAQWEKVDRLHLRPLFDVILVSGDHPWEKPHHMIFHEACGYLGVPPETCVMVGDKLETDIIGGIYAGFAGNVWVPLNGQKRVVSGEMKPDHVIGQVEELGELLPEMKYSLRRSKMFRRLALADMDDCNSNSSDGS